MTTHEFLALHDWKCAYCGAQAHQRDHVVPSSPRKRYGIKHSDERYHVPACRDCNGKKATYRFYPRGFDVDLLPGDGWQEYHGEPVSRMFPA